MDKDIKRLDLNTPDGTQLNMDALYQIAPSVFTESRDEKTGELKRVVNFDALRQLLGDNAVDESRETYEFRWVGKDAAKSEAARAIDKTLRPVVEDSVDWDTTKNLYIEGDNLEVLKLLQRSYMGKVKMIYIDPPYNTGNDFVYHDYFDRSKYEEELASGAIDELGLRYLKSSENDGQFHSNWCSMIYSRLMVARSLLSEDGVIFISIDDNEVENLRKICDEVFGENNFLANLIWSNKEGGGSSDSKLFRIKNEHILCFAKNIENVEIKGVPISNVERYKGKDEYLKIRGPYYLQKLGMGSIQYSNSLDYEIICPDGSSVKPSDNNNGKKACWRWSREKFNKNSQLGFVEIKKDSNGIWTVYTKQYLNCDNDGNIIERTQRPMGIIDAYSSTQAAKMLRNMQIPFDYSKPVELISYFIDRFYGENSIILDFFSGSATTAHAVMQLNAEDGGNRKFIMVQLPELTDEDSEAYKDGYNNICEIGEERIRRAGEKIKEEHPEVADTLDTGFRVFRLDDSNFNPEVKATPSEYSQQQLDLFANNIKTDRTDLDLLFGSTLAWGLQLDLPMETEEVDGCKIYTVNEGDLVACFAEKVTDKVIEAMAEKEPLRVLFRDSCFDSDDKKINIFETFKQKLDWTDDEAFNNIRVI